MRLLIILAAMTGIFSATSAHAADFYVNGSAHYGCIHKDDYKKTLEFVAQNDREAFNQFLGLGISTGVCTMFTAGEQVYVSNSGLLA